MNLGTAATKFDAGIEPMKQRVKDRKSNDCDSQRYHKVKTERSPCNRGLAKAHQENLKCLSRLATTYTYTKIYLSDVLGLVCFEEENDNKRTVSPFHGLRQDLPMS